MTKAAKVLTEFTLMAMAVLFLVAACAYIVVQLVSATQKPKVFAREAKAADLKVDKSGNLEYQGRFLGQLKEQDVRHKIRGLPNLPNGATDPSVLSLGNGKWLIIGGTLPSDSAESSLNGGSLDNYLFEESTKKLQPLPPLMKAIWWPTFFKLANGNILILGRSRVDDENKPESPIQLLDFEKKRISTVGLLSVSRPEVIGALEIAPNKVLAVVGGASVPADGDLIDVDKHSCTKVCALNRERFGPFVFHISGNDYLVVDGQDWFSTKTARFLSPEIISLPPAQQ